jgi:hypothetical protein
MYLLQLSILRETTTLADGCLLHLALPLELGHGLGHHLRIKVSQIPVRPLLCFIFPFSIFQAHDLIAPAVSRAPPLPPPTSRPNRSDEQRSNATYSSSSTSSVKARDQPGSDSTITTTSTTVDNPPAPEPRQPSTRNRMPSYTNPWGMYSPFMCFLGFFCRFNLCF